MNITKHNKFDELVKEMRDAMTPEEQAAWDAQMEKARIEVKKTFADRRANLLWLRDTVYESIVTEMAEATEVRQPGQIAEQATNATMRVLRFLVDDMRVRDLEITEDGGLRVVDEGCSGCGCCKGK